MLRIGWASRDFTPTRPAMLHGQMNRRIAYSAMDPLTVTAWVLEGDSLENNTIFISCDICHTSDLITNAIRERLAARIPEVRSDRIVVNATHTHTSLVMEDGPYEQPDGDVMTPTECFNRLVDFAAEAAAAAWDSRQPGSIGRAFGHAVVGHNRYAVYKDRHAQMYGKTDGEDFVWIGGYEDHSLDMLFTWDPKGQLTGMALAIPCPSQVDEQLEVFTADYWHDVRMELRKRFGAHLQILPICSTAGDQSPHFLLYAKQEAEMRQRHGLTERQEIARRVADAVEFALKDTHPDQAMDNPLVHRSERLLLTPWKITKEQRDWAENAYNQWRAEYGESTSWWPVSLRRVVDRFEGREIAPPVPAEIHVVRIGDAVIATNPFEFNLDYGMQMKAWSPAAQTITMQLACSDGSYVPSERYVPGGGYGAMPAVCEAGSDGGRELVLATLAHIKDLWK